MSTKRLFSCLVVIGLLAVVVFTICTGMVVGEEKAAESEISLTLSQAIQMALPIASETRSAALAVEEAQISLREAQIRQLEGRPSSELEQAELALQQAQDSYRDALVTVALEVEEAYYAVLRAKETLDIQIQSQERENRQFSVTKARFDAGLIAEQDFLEAELSHDKALASLEQTRRQLENALLDFGFLVGIDEGYAASTNILLTQAFPFALFRMSLEEALTEGLANRQEITRGNRDLDRAKAEVRATDNDYTAPVELQKAKIALVRAEISLEKGREQVQRDVRQGWITLQSSEKKVDDCKRAEELVQRRLKITQAKYDAGRTSLLELMSDQSSAAQAQLDAVGAVWDYSLSKARFLRTLGRSELPTLPEGIQSYLDTWQRGAEID